MTNIQPGKIQKRLASLSGRGWTYTPYGPPGAGGIFEEKIRIRANGVMVSDDQAKLIATGKAPKFPVGTSIEFLHRRVIVSIGAYPGGPTDEWMHASLSLQDQMPTYDDLVLLHKAVWPDGWAYQVFAPPEHHINIHAYALHLWGRPDGRAELPNFGENGTI